MGIGHDTCHLYRLATPTPWSKDTASGRLTASERLALPRNLWPIIAARVAAGESLRALAQEYGTSHESIRRIAQSAARTAATRPA